MLKKPTRANLHFTTFETAFGFASLVWNENGLAAFIFPEKTKTKNLKVLKQKNPHASFSSELPKEIKKTTRLIQRYFEGAPVSLSSVSLDDHKLPPFWRKVYKQARQIPAGQTLSYKELALKAGSPKAARAVGQAMARNPWPIFVPCHRVLSSRGELTGFSAGEGLRSKQRLLWLERSTRLK